MAGRPSAYDASYCDQIEEWGDQGKSVVWMASQLRVTRDTLYEWAKVHPEFSDAFTQARLNCQAWWEDQGQTGMVTPGFNAAVWSKNMGARFKDDWSEKTMTEISGPNGGPVAMVGIDASKLTDEQLRAIASIPINAG